MRRSWRPIALAALAAALLASAASAAEWYVAPNGISAAKGTHASPWDLESALGGTQSVAPGDTLWIRGGTYKKPFELLGRGFPVRIAGRAGAPVQVRAFNDERVTIDGGLDIEPPASHLWIRDLEIMVSEPRPEKAVPADPTYKAAGRPWGGLNINTGAGCKYINLVIHDNLQGVSFWREATDNELYGCLIYDNGRQAMDRGHGHAITTQNDNGTKTISDGIMTGGYGYTLHAYGSNRADVNNYLVEGNICYNGGPFLIGGGRPSHGIPVFRNYLYNVPMRLGYGAHDNEDCEVRGNVIARGELAINQFRKVESAGNLIVTKSDRPPPGTRVFLRVNQYDPGRANLAIYNFDRKPFVAVDAAAVLKPGDRFRLMNPRDFYGKPVLTGTYSGQPIRVPVAGEFAAFVLLKLPKEAEHASR